MLKVEEIMREKNLSKMRVSLNAGINPPDFYQALNGKKPFFPAWRKRVSEALEISEDELFPEYNKE